MAVDEQGKVLFREVQHFRRWWTFAIIAMVALVGWWAFLEQIVYGRPWGDKPAPDWAVWLVFVFCSVGIPLLFLLARLVVEVTPTALHARYVPFARRRYAARDLKGVQVVTFRPIRDWGGWGIRWSRGKGWAYTATGNQGVRLDLADGKTFTIGSQRPDQLAEAIRSLLG